MGDFSNYAQQGLQPSKTVTYEVTELTNPDGTHPVLHVEHLGEANFSFIEESIARAGEGATDRSQAELYRYTQDTVIRHSVKKLELAFFSDGTPAGDDAIPGFVKAMAVQALQRLITFVRSEENFCMRPIATPPAVIAEK